MTPSRKNNKHNPPESNNGVTGKIKSSSTNYYIQNYSQQRRDQTSRNVSGVIEKETFSQQSKSSHSDKTQQLRASHKDHKASRNESEFIPLFVLVDASRENNERKVREICQKLSLLSAAEAEPVVNFQDQTGRTALSYGCGCGTITVIDEVSRFKFTDPNLLDNEGNSPLHYSAVCGHCEGIDILLSRFHGTIDANARNTSGLTPLMKAALQGRTRCAKSLLSAGASPSLRDYIRELTAAEWAKLCGRHMCADIINRSEQDNHREELQPSHSSSLLTRTFPQNHHTTDEQSLLGTEELPYYHLYARTTVSGAKWLKAKIKKALGASVRTGEDKSFVFDNPAVRSLADRRPTISDRNYTVLSNLGLGGATICASSLLLPNIQPVVEKQRQKVNRKVAVPMVRITPVRR